GSTRARACLRSIEGQSGANLVINAARLLASRKAQGAAGVLLGYLPYAEDNNTFAEIEAALVAVGLKDGKPDPALVKAIKDRVSLRRGAAARVICEVGGAAFHPYIRPLLKDPKPSVRLRAALALVGAYDAEAIPVLIDLLADLQPALRNQAEDYLTHLAGEWAVSGPRGNDQMSRRLRRDVWAAWWKQTDGAGLLDEFKTRTPSDSEIEKVTALIKKLDAPSAEARDSASQEIIGFGRKASSLLRQAVHQNHPRISPFAARCLEAIEKDTPNPLPAAAPRLLALRRPEGTVEALLGYLPCCESEDVATQLIDVLATVGAPGGKASEALTRALEDRIAARRAAAAVALCKARATGQLANIGKLLEDPDTSVRLRAAQGLAALGQKPAVPVLIALLADLPLEQVWEVEDYLSQVAGDKTPSQFVT